MVNCSIGRSQSDVNTGLYNLRDGTTEDAVIWLRIRELDKLTCAHLNEVKIMKKLEFKRIFIELSQIQLKYPQLKNVSKQIKLKKI